jgi:transcriptional regulator with XRE-family HTH domain
MAGQRGIYARRIVSRNVRRLRDALGMNQEELADSARLTQSQLSKIESGKLNFRLDVVQRLAGALGVRMADLFDETKRK